MFGLVREQAFRELVEEHESLCQRMKLLERRLGLTYNAGVKKRAHYKVHSEKIGRPKKQ